MLLVFNEGAHNKLIYTIALYPWGYARLDGVSPFFANMVSCQNSRVPQSSAQPRQATEQSTTDTKETKEN